MNPQELFQEEEAGRSETDVMRKKRLERCCLRKAKETDAPWGLQEECSPGNTLPVPRRLILDFQPPELQR
jgi:hypothetical protein